MDVVVTVPTPALYVTVYGAGVIAALATEDALPVVFVATALKVYAVPLVKPVTMQEVAVGITVQVLIAVVPAYAVIV